MAARGGRESNRANSAVADGLPRLAVRDAFRDGTAPANVVQSVAAGQNAVPIVCLVQRGLAAGAGQLSFCVRAAVFPAGTSRGMGVGFWAVCFVVRRMRITVVAEGGGRSKKFFIVPPGTTG